VKRRRHLCRRPGGQRPAPEYCSYTDGLTEARQDDKLFGLEGVSAALGRLNRPSPTEAVAVLRARVAAFAYGTLTDDLCLLAARITLEPRASASA
jgi:serine phosphatase RsbU (regulator of sigma subunit)